jgi:lipid II:glycine glycyltransferase (peptidoglycan interpeptide bridge formation enzyme)
MPEVSLAQWNQFLTSHPEAHLLQTGEWGELKTSFGWEAIRLLTHERQAGAQILFRQLPLGWTLAYLPKGPVGRGGEPLWSEVDRICRKRNAILLKCELDDWNLKEDGEVESVMGLTGVSGIPEVRTSLHNIQPPRTIVVSLDGSEDEILARMKQKTRYNIRLAQKKGVAVRSWDDLPAFHDMLQVTGERDGFGVHSLEYYQRAYELFHPPGVGELLVAEYEGHPLAALMVFARGQRAWYVYGASTGVERNRMPTYLLQWEAMRWARAKDAVDYDLWGVPDHEQQDLEAHFTERRDGLWGVYRFKRGFGGELIRAVQAIDLIYKPLLYKAYEWRMAGREAV